MKITIFGWPGFQSRILFELLGFIIFGITYLGFSSSVPTLHTLHCFLQVFFAWLFILLLLKQSWFEDKNDTFFEDDSLVVYAKWYLLALWFMFTFSTYRPCSFSHDSLGFKAAVEHYLNSQNKLVTQLRTDSFHNFHESLRLLSVSLKFLIAATRGHWCINGKGWNLFFSNLTW